MGLFRQISEWAKYLRLQLAMAEADESAAEHQMNSRRSPGPGPERGENGDGDESARPAKTSRSPQRLKPTRKPTATVSWWLPCTRI